MSNPVQELFSRRFKRLRERKEVTMVDLADTIGMSQATISEWEKGNKFPRSGALQQLAIYFNVPMEYFFKEDAFLKVKMIDIPVYQSSLLGKSANIVGMDCDEIEYIGLPASSLAGYSKDEEFIAFEVIEESMNLLFPRTSQIVGIRFELEKVKDGDIVLYCYNNNYDIRRFRRNEQQEVFVLSPESSDKKYFDTIIPFKASDDLEIIAKVIWYGVLI